MVEIATALAGIKAVRELGASLLTKYKDAETQKRVHEITTALGDVQSKLYELREENITLLDEKRVLAEKLRAAEDRTAKRAHYKLVTTPGGATLPQFDGHDGSLQHYVCPACLESNGKYHPLQDERSWTGHHRCSACKASYPVDTASARRGPLYPQR